MDDFDKTMPGHHLDAASDVTMPGKRDRKPDGRFSPGDVIMARYRVLAELGQGGMGVVYKCFDETAGIEIALKALPPELSHNTLEMEDIKENFQLVHDLHHPNIASSNNLEKDNTNGNYYLIMECVEGEDLRRWIKRKRKDGSLTLETVLPVIQQVAAALDYAHKEKIIHRDIKPGNIMINSEGEVKVLDFGLAAQIHTSMTRVSMAYHGTSGTGPYMAPEQWKGRAQGAPADQYALAVMTYEMLAGHLPFESTDAAVLQQAVLTQKADAVPDIPFSAQKALQRAMSKEPSERFASCLDFVSALSGEKVTGPGRNTQGNRKLFWTMGVAVAVVALLAGIFVFVKSEDTSERTSLRPALEANTEVKEAPAFEARPATANPAKVEFNGAVTLPGNVEMKLIKVESGSFTMSKKDGENYSDEKEHLVNLTSDFYLGETEVTQGQYQAVMRTNPSYFKNGDSYPVEMVSWHDAMAFCEKLNELPEVKRPAGYKFSLPTETQWEYACRGGKKSKGYKYSGSNNLNDVGWYDANSYSTTHPVKSKRNGANELGFYDMSGNVWEWCLDDYQGDSRNATPKSSRGNDEGGSYRVVRGGSWCSRAKICRSAYRRDDAPGYRHYFLGFRVALVPVQ